MAILIAGAVGILRDCLKRISARHPTPRIRQAAHSSLLCVRVVVVIGMSDETYTHTIVLHTSARQSAHL